MRSDEPLARKTAALLFAACGKLGIFTQDLVAIRNEIVAGDPRPTVIIVPKERSDEIGAILAIPGTQKLEMVQNGDGTQKRWIPGLGLTTLAKGAEVFVVPKRVSVSAGKPRRRRK